MSPYDVSNPPSSGPVILAVTPYSEDARFLQSVFRAQTWRLRTCPTVAGALSHPELESVTVVLCEHELPDGTWRDLLAGLSSREFPPQVIVTSLHADERLWAEVLNLGGFDVLAKPLDHAETLRVLGQAQRHWAAGAA